MNKILISACFLGENVRYDGNNNALSASILKHWQQEGRLIAICPEVSGGLPVPRDPAEIQGQYVVTIAGEDVTDSFYQGAQHALELCQLHHISLALLKEGSPSCGSQKIHDGSFQHSKIAGQGITTQLLKKHHIQVFNEHECDQLVRMIHHLEC